MTTNENHSHPKWFDAREQFSLDRMLATNKKYHIFYEHLKAHKLQFQALFETNRINSIQYYFDIDFALRY